MTSSVGEGTPAGSAPPRAHPGLAAAWRTGVERLVRGLDRLRLPGATVLPVAGAVVGLYGGLAAGVFANLIGVVSGVVFGWPQLVDIVHPGSQTRAALADSLTHAAIRNLKPPLHAFSSFPDAPGAGAPLDASTPPPRRTHGLHPSEE